MKRCSSRSSTTDQAAEVFRAAETSANSEAGADKYLVFNCDGQLLGIDISEVKQIIQMPQITPLFDSFDYVKGFTCMHGEVIVIMDMRVRMGKPEIEPDDRTCVIIFPAAADRCSYGIIVDGVESIENIGSDEILPPPQEQESRVKYLTGIVGRKPAILLIRSGFLTGEIDMSMLNGIPEAEGCAIAM